MKRIALTFVLLLSPQWALAQNPADANISGTVLNIESTGRLSSIPDVANISATVTSKADDPSSALSQVSQKTSELTDALRKAGIRENDLRTLNVSVSQSYLKLPDGRRGEPNGFVASSTIRAKVRDLKLASQILALMAKVDGTGISGPQFELSNELALKKQARDEAIKQAQTTAAEIAASLNKRVVRMIRLTVANQYAASYDSSRNVGTVQVVGPQLYPGESAVTASVSAVFELAD